MPKIPVLDAEGNPVDVELPNANGRQDDTQSRPVALSNQDLAAIGATNSPPASDENANTGLNGLLKALLARLRGTLQVVVTDPVEAVYTDYPGLTEQQLRDAPLEVLDGTAGYTITQTTITGTGSAQSALAANANRKAVIFWDAGAANDFRFNFFGAATTTSPIYPPDSGPLTLEGPACPKGALSVIGTAGQLLCIWECV